MEMGPLMTIQNKNTQFAYILSTSDGLYCLHCGSKKNAPTSADYNYDPVQSILIILASCLLTIIKVVRW